MPSPLFDSFGAIVPWSWRNAPKVGISSPSGYQCPFGLHCDHSCWRSRRGGRDPAGALLHDFLVRADGFLPATCSDHHAGPSGTWRVPNGPWHRIDYIIVPSAWRHFGLSSKVLCDFESLQARDDHRPVCLTCTFCQLEEAGFLLDWQTPGGPSRPLPSRMSRNTCGLADHTSMPLVYSCRRTLPFPGPCLEFHCRPAVSAACGRTSTAIPHATYASGADQTGIPTLPPGRRSGDFPSAYAYRLRCLCAPSGVAAVSRSHNRPVQMPGSAHLITVWRRPFPPYIG